MASYRITAGTSVWTENTVTKRNKAAAMNAARQMAYDLIASIGLLDRIGGHNFCNRVAALELSPPKRGYQTEWTIRLSDSATIGENPDGTLIHNPNYDVKIRIITTRD